MSNAWRRDGLANLIPGELLQEFERWPLPEVGNPQPKKEELPEEPEEELPQPPTVEEIEAIQREAFEEGYKAGLDEGRIAGKAEYDAHCVETDQERKRLQAVGEELRQLMASLQRPFEALDDQVEEETTELAMLVARQVVRRELQLDSRQVVAVVREALGILPVSARRIRLQLNPADAELVREALALDPREDEWQIVEDPRITRGGCEVVSELSRIDATIERRLNGTIASVLGDQREEERG
jgi:flagellar assembly protein FliH